MRIFTDVYYKSPGYIGRISGLFSLTQYQYGIQKVSSQSDDQHFKDCRTRMLENLNRYSQALDRYENGEDIRTEMSSVLSEGMVIGSDCGDIDPTQLLDFNLIILITI